MQYEIGYTTFEGASGNDRIIADSLPNWLSNRPGTSIHYINNISTSDDMEAQRAVRNQALKEFAEGILRSIP